MQWRGKLIYFGIGIGLLLIGAIAAIRKPPPPASELVAQQANNLVTAFNRADNRNLLNIISSDFSASGWTKPRLQLALLRWKRQGIQATIHQAGITASGNKEFTVTASLQARDTRTQEGVWSAPEAVLTFRLERPTPDVPFLPGTWRLVSVAGASLPEASIAD